MKKFLLAFLLLAGQAFGQAIDSSQIKLKTGGGLAGDTANALTVAPYRASSAPSSPVTGQLWCDTTGTPCTLKQYNGSTWVTPQVNAAITTQATITTFPASPVDGQVFFSKSPRALWVYDSTAAAWFALQASFYNSAANVIDSYTAAVITAPGSAATATISATAGSTGAGTYSYKITYYNSTGGETTPSAVSNTVTPGASKSVDLSAIPTGGTGTTGRRIYRSKSGGAVSGPWYYIAALVDNSTTTYHDGAADAALYLSPPDVNFSGALPSGWSVIDNGGSLASGGCGVTGRSTMVCMTSHFSCACNASTCGAQGNFTNTSDVMVRASRDITAYNSGNYTITLRVKHVGVTGDANVAASNPTLWGLRNGVADNAKRVWWATGTNGGGGCAAGNITLPWTSSNRPVIEYSDRAGAAGSVSGCSAGAAPFPQADGEPLYFKIVRRGSTTTSYISYDGVNFASMILGTGASNATANGGYNSALYPLDHVEIIPFGNNGAGPPGSGGQVFIEIDQFTITVN